MSDKAFLVVDVGSTTTKAILIESGEDGYRVAERGEAPTTVEKPDEDVMVGVRNAIGQISRPLDTTQFLATSSAGGGLQVIVCGLSKFVTAESAEKAALGAGALLMDVFSADDGRSLFEQMEALRTAKPDMVLLAGGIDRAVNVDFIIEFCDLLNSTRPVPRFGQGHALPVVYAGCPNGRPFVQDTLAQGFELHIVSNLRPTLDEENLGPAREAIHDVFLTHVMAQAPGYLALKESVCQPVMPTPLAVGRIMTRLAERDDIEIVGADIGGATTDVFSVLDHEFNRTVSANLGMSYSVGNVLLSAGIENIMRWLPFAVDATWLQDRVMDKLIFPTTVPATLLDLLLEQALAREALRLSLEHHVSLVTSLNKQPSAVQRALLTQDAQLTSTRKRQQLLDMRRIGLLVGSGGVLSHAPRRTQAAAMLIDAFAPLGYTFLAVDSIFMMPHLGVLSESEPEIALEVLDRDCFIPLGPCMSLVAAAGSDLGKVAGKLTLRTPHKVSQLPIHVGEVLCFPLSRAERGLLRIEAEAGFDFGAGAGRVLERSLTGGEVGVIIDARGQTMADLPLAEQQTLTKKTLLGLGAFSKDELEQCAEEVLHLAR